MVISGTDAAVTTFNETLFKMVISRVFNVPTANITIVSHTITTSTVRRLTAGTSQLSVQFTVKTTTTMAPLVTAVMSSNVAAIGPMYAPGSTSFYTAAPSVPKDKGALCVVRRGRVCCQWLTLSI